MKGSTIFSPFVTSDDDDGDDDERDGEHPSACCIAVAYCLKSIDCCDIISLIPSYAFTWCKKAAENITRRYITVAAKLFYNCI